MAVQQPGHKVLPEHCLSLPACLPRMLTTSACSAMQFRRLGLNARLRVSERRQAAVAADLILSWRRALNDLHAGPVSPGCFSSREAA